MKKIGIIALALGAAAGGAAWLRRIGLFRRDGGGEPLAPAAGGDGPNDETLKSKVESEIFRDAEAPKGQVNVNAQFGVVQLRGEVESQELIDDLVARARSVQGVVRVENLLHVPGTPAPMHQ